NPRPRLDDKAADIDQKTEGQDQRQQQVDPVTQRKFLPHCSSSGFPARPQLPIRQDGALTAQLGGYLIETYSNIVSDACPGGQASRRQRAEPCLLRCNNGRARPYRTDACVF